MEKTLVDNFEVVPMKRSIAVYIFSCFVGLHGCEMCRCNGVPHICFFGLIYFVGPVACIEVGNRSIDVV